MKGTTRLPVTGAALLTLLAAPPVEVSAQYDTPPPPAAYALQNVTVVDVEGNRTPGMNVVVRDGLVEAIGSDIAIPADARLLEGDSLFVYPGLVDADAGADVDFPDPVDVDEDEDVRSWDPPRSASGFMPHRRVAHHLAVTGEGVADQRADGIVAGLVHPTGGMAAGQPAVVVFRADAEVPWELVNRETAGLTMSFRQGRGVYPSQLFGVIAYLRQGFLDAERYATARGTYESDPSGMTAPPWDPDFEALLRATSGEVPVYFSADSDEDIRRVLNLADEFGFRPVIVGGAEAWKLADELASRGVAVLVSTDFPEPDEWDPEEDPAPAELEPDAAREKERLENIWSNAGRLEAAGVTFAFTTDGGGGDLLDGARKAVEYGLTEAGALRALTATPAELIGMPELARVTEGAGATFIVAQHELFAEEAGVVYTFVEGHLEEGEALEDDGGEGGEEPAADLSGEWTGRISAQGQEVEFSFNLTMEEDGSITGTMSSDFAGAADLSGSVSGREVTFSIETEGMPEPIRMTATLSEDGTRMEGSAESPMGELSFTATKEPGVGTTVRSWLDLFGGRAATTSGGGR